MESYTESGWQRGWIPSSDDKRTPGSNEALGLVRLKNLNLDEEGIVRICKAPLGVSDINFNYVKSIYSTVHSGLGSGYPSLAKLRYVYSYTAGPSGTLYRNYDATNKAVDKFGKTIFTGGTTEKCTFATALGHIFAFAGTKKYKDDGLNSSTIGLAASSAPTVAGQTPSTLDVSNEAATLYTNWADEESSVHTNGGAFLLQTVNTTTLRASSDTTYGTPLDFTNLGGTGKDTPEDLFTFDFQSTDPASITKIRLQFEVDANGNYFYKEWSGSELSAADEWTTLRCTRGDFIYSSSEIGSWTAIASARIIVEALNVITYQMRDLVFTGGSTGNLTGEFEYRLVQLHDTTQYVEHGLNANTTTVTLTNQKALITPVGTPVTNANKYRVYRRSEKTAGEFLEVASGSISGGAFGAISPTYDNVTDAEAIEAAAIDPERILNQYRTALPDNIRGAIWFVDRLVVINRSTVIPTFAYDPGSYDSRFTYEISNGNSELLLFIEKIDIGRFIVATTKDFYIFTGDFAPINEGGVLLQNISVKPLKVADPAISDTHALVSGGLMYLSATGIRILYNTTSELVNGPLDLIMQGETRYDVGGANLQFGDQTIASVAISGDRTYWALQNLTSDPLMFVNTKRANGSYWRLYDTIDTDADYFVPYALFTEEDGTVIGAGGTGHGLYELEGQVAHMAADFETQFNFGNQPLNRKDSSFLMMEVDTGNTDMTLTVTVMLKNGGESTFSTTFKANGTTIKRFDIGTLVSPFLAAKIRVEGVVATFSLSYLTFFYEPRPAPVSRVKLLADDFKQPGKKHISVWPFRLDSYGENVNVIVRKDGVAAATQVVNVAQVAIARWLNTATAADLANIWEIELIAAGSSGEFEFFGFLDPTIVELTPVFTKYISIAKTDGGKANRRCLSAWPFKINGQGYTITAKLTCDGTVIETQSIVTPNRVAELSFHTTNATLGNVWTLELYHTNEFEFYEFRDPVFSEERPVKTRRVLAPYSDFGVAAFKSLTTFPVTVDPLGGTLTWYLRADGTSVTTGTLSGSGIQDFLIGYTGSSLGITWELEITSTAAFEFIKFGQPVFSEVRAVKVHRAITLNDDLGHSGRKTVATWPFRANPLGGAIAAALYADDVQVASGVFTGSAIADFFLEYSGSVLAAVWRIELTCPALFEFYEFKKPLVTEQRPTVCRRVILPYTNFKKTFRKDVNAIPFIADLRGSTATLYAYADGTAFATQTITSSRIQTLEWSNPGSTLAVDWQLVIVSNGDMEFFEFGDPTIVQECPDVTTRARLVANNFGKANKKKLANWPFVANLLGHSGTLTVTKDGTTYDVDTFTSGDTVKTHFWYNLFDQFGVDWAAELVVPSGMEFYKFMPPEILQILPPTKMFDQLGPVDFSQKGLVYSFRLRVLPEGTSLHYKVYEEDTMTFEADIAVTANKDNVYIEKLPRGIDPSICRVIVTSDSPFHRFDAEFYVIPTGKGLNEGKFLRIS